MLMLLANLVVFSYFFLSNPTFSCGQEATGFKLYPLFGAVPTMLPLLTVLSVEH
jgi:hypothetical protein